MAINAKFKLHIFHGTYLYECCINYFIVLNAGYGYGV